MSWTCSLCGRLRPPGEPCAGCGSAAVAAPEVAAEVADLEALFAAPSYVAPSSPLAAIRVRDLGRFDYAAGERPEVRPPAPAGDAGRCPGAGRPVQLAIVREAGAIVERARCRTCRTLLGPWRWPDGGPWPRPARGHDRGR